MAIHEDGTVHSANGETRVLEQFFMETGDCIFSIDGEMNIRMLNPAMEKLFGVSSSEVIGKKCFEFLRWRKDNRRALCIERCPIMRSFQGGEKSTYREGLLEISKWKKLWVGTTASCVRDEAGGIKEIIFVMRDITYLKDIQKKMEAEIRTFESLAKSTKGIELKIPCMSEYVVTARAQAELIAKRMKFNSERIQDIKSAVGEACDNAIEHGGSQRGVDIRYKMRGANLLIEVEDYGAGFDPGQAGMCLPSPYIEGGRGIYLMRNLADDMRIESEMGQGTKVTMEISRKPEAYRRLNRTRSWKQERKVCIM